jgi:hypothetical protein
LSDLLWTPESESKGESDLVWTPESESKEEPDLVWTGEPDLARHLLLLSLDSRFFRLHFLYLLPLCSSKYPRLVSSLLSLPSRAS